MRGSLAVKVFWAVFGTAALLVVAITAASVWRVDRSFQRYVLQLELERLRGLVEQVQRDHAARGDWGFVPDQTQDPDAYRRWFNRAMGQQRPPRGPAADVADALGLPPPTPDGPPRNGPSEGPPDDAATGTPPDAPPRDANRPAPRPPDRLALMRRVAFFDAQGRNVGGAPVPLRQCAAVPVEVQGQVVGQVGLHIQKDALATAALAFLREQWRDALWMGAAALLLSAAVSLLFARHLRRPVRELVAGTQALTRGALTTRLPTDRRDEFGLLADHFNLMAAQLEQQERSRREWLASTSHELRTPLTVLRALIEALQEGIRQGDPATLKRLHEQVMSLTRLVDDLHQLAQHDAGNTALALSTLRPHDLVDDVLDALAPRLQQVGLQLSLDDLDPELRLQADPQRLRQLVLNLVENSLRYTDAPGRLHISLRRAAGGWQAEFEDSAPGVPPEALPRLFERFYRGEASRSRATGGSGLGLAIGRAIAAQHGGSLQAFPSALGGLKLVLWLPISRS